MREIKFRAWNKKRGDMMSWKDLSKYDYLTDSLKNKDRIVMQYIGIKDKKGNEVWEGDIVKTGEGFIGVVEFRAEDDYGTAEYVIDTGCEDIDKIIYDGDGIKEALCTPLKVLGNIYQNPELLK